MFARSPHQSVSLNNKTSIDCTKLNDYIVTKDNMSIAAVKEQLAVNTDVHWCTGYSITRTPHI